MVRAGGRWPARWRRGMASLEVVLATGVTFPVVGGMFYLGVRACRNLFHVIGNLVGWPF